MKAKFEVIDANTFFGPSQTPAMDLSLDSLIQAVNNHGIAKACTLSTVGFCHNYVEGNQATIAACAGHAELIPVAAVDPRGVFSAVASEIAALPSLGFRMFRFFPDEQGWPIRYAPFVDALDAIEPTGLPVMIGVAEAGQATAILEIVKGRRNAFILTGSPYEGLAEACSVMRKANNVFLETNSLLASGSFGLMVREVGSGRLVFGSGCPRASLAGALRQIEASELGEADKVKILSGNIKTLLGI